MDFFQILTKEVDKGKALEVYPDFVVKRTSDLMIRGSAFYAVWDEEAGLWSTDEFDARRLVDEEVLATAKKLEAEGFSCKPKLCMSYETNRWNQFRKYLKNVSDSYNELDMSLTFANTEVTKADYVSRRLPYNLEPGSYDAWDELIGRLYNPEERAKIEWAIGAVISGDSKKIQKFLVLYGPPGHGKGTVIEILLKLFKGYTTTFDAKELTKNNNTFATEKFRGNPLVAIQHDGDLSRIEDNTKLNSIISHEEMTVNEKFKPQYDAKVHAFLFLGTNKAVRITDAKSGLIRRLIDVHPSGNLFTPNHYYTLMSRIDFELGAIAYHCLEVYRAMGRNYYSNYKPLDMIMKTDIFFNFIEAHYDIFRDQDGVSLKQAYTLYKEYCSDTGIEKPLPQYKVREQLENYFDEFIPRTTVDGRSVSSYFSGFSADKFKAPVGQNVEVFSLVIEDTTSIFDLEAAEWPAQYTKEDGTPQKRWADVKTRLAELNTSELHYVRVPENHIVIDFDLRGNNGEKSLERNLQAASELPPTYAELSKSGAGVHLHYLYEGDVTDLSPQYSEGIEVKVFSGNSSLRRRLSKCNNVPIAKISSGLPLKEKKVLNYDTIKGEKALRSLIAKNLRKEVHPGTKPSIDFIKKILDDAYDSGITYDVTDLRSKVIAFANNSTNQNVLCLSIVQKMKWKSEDVNEDDGTINSPQESEKPKDDRLAFFDVEVYPNLFVICWKFAGDASMVVMINPSAQEVEELLKLKLVGFNNRRYDNHILYAAYMGYDNDRLYKLSQKIIDGSEGALFSAAYGLSYTDILDFSSKKQSLKKFGIELGLHHMEMDIPWDQPVPEDLWPKVVEYCSNDVKTTEATFDARKGDYLARKILADLSGLTPNDTTQKHTTAIIFGGVKNPQREFIYTDLSRDFPGYVYDFGKATYRDEPIGMGGYVYSEPGMYEDVALLDVASMHPTSIIQLDLFGPYTGNFREIVEARLEIKEAVLAFKKGNAMLAEEHLVNARGMFDGRLVPYLENQDDLKPLAEALKIAINIVYGLTSASFNNAFRDPRNKDNIVAKRGALFMVDLKHFIQEAGFQVVHIKTDSVKIPGATPWLIEQIVQFGEKYGYHFEHEATYDKFCLVNDAVYIAREDIPAKLEGSNKQAWTTKWTAVGAQFQEPYVYKTLFSGEDVTFDDMCLTKQVVNGGMMYLDFEGVKPMSEANHTEMQFVGKTGRFVPIKEGYGGGILYRVKDGKQYAVGGTKGYFWMEATLAKDLPPEAIDSDYFEHVASEAQAAIEKYGSFEEFVK